MSHSSVGRGLGECCDWEVAGDDNCGTEGAIGGLEFTVMSVCIGGQGKLKHLGRVGARFDSFGA